MKNTITQKRQVPTPESLVTMCKPNGAQVLWKKTADFCRNRASSKRPIAGLATRYPSWLLDYICIGIWMQVGPVIRFHMFSVSLDCDTPSTSKTEPSISLLYSSRGKRLTSSNVPKWWTRFAKNPLPIYASNHGWLVMCECRASDSYIIDRKINGKAVERTL